MDRSPSALQTLCNTAHEARRAGDFSTAIAAFRQALDLEPSADLFFFLALVLEAAIQWKPAYDALNQAHAHLHHHHHHHQDQHTWICTLTHRPFARHAQLVNHTARVGATIAATYADQQRHRDALDMAIHTIRDACEAGHTRALRSAVTTLGRVPYRPSILQANRTFDQDPAYAQHIFQLCAQARHDAPEAVHHLLDEALWGMASRWQNHAPSTWAAQYIQQRRVTDAEYGIFDQYDTHTPALIDQLGTWTEAEIHHTRPTTPLATQYPSVEAMMRAWMPHIVQETKAQLRAAWHRPLLSLTIRDVEADRDRVILHTSPFPAHVIQHSRSHLVLWIVSMQCIGVADAFDDAGPTIVLHGTVPTATQLECRFLGSVVTFDRMYTTCRAGYATPPIVQVAAGTATPWSAAPRPISPDDTLNGEQRAIVEDMVASPNGLLLLQGPPGTGKTTTIVGMIQAMTQRGRSVLVTAPSNKAVHTLAARVHAHIPHVPMRLVGTASKTPKALQSLLSSVWKVWRVQLARVIDSFVTKKALSQHLGGFSHAQVQAAAVAMEEIRVASRRVQRGPWEPNGVALTQLIMGLAQLTETQRREWQAALSSNVPTGAAAQYLAKGQALREAWLEVLPHSDDDLVLDADVVFCTCTVAGRSLFRRLELIFDVVVVDEAAQALPSESLIPLHMAKRVGILVGDPAQLPPTVQGDAAVHTGFGESTMARMVASGQPCRMLQTQYRMHPEIRTFPSRFCYGDGLRDARVVGERVCPLDASVSFVPYGVVHCPGAERSVGSSYANDAEVTTVARVVAMVRAGATRPISMGVISFYAAQVAVLTERLPAGPDLLIGTVDGFQGSERDVMLVSCVRANAAGRVGFAEDTRRINVALTRARHALCVVGHVPTLERGGGMLSAMVADAKHRGCYFSVEGEAKV